MAKVYGLPQLERMIEREINTNAKKGLLGEKEILLMLQEQLPSHAYIIHNPALLHYEADILVIEETIGFMFLEVKTWNNLSIGRFYPNGKIKIQQDTQDPLKQAENYREELKSTLSSLLGSSNKPDLHRLISSVVVFNGISLDTFLQRSEVVMWDEEWKNKFLAKHFFYTKYSSDLYIWMIHSKKFKNSILSSYLTASDLEEIINILVHHDEDRKPVVNKKVPILVQRSQDQFMANINELAREDKNKVVELQSIPKEKKKWKLTRVLGLVAIALLILFYNVNGWKSDEDTYEMQESTISESEVFMASRDEGISTDLQDPYNYFILADSQDIKLTETQLYGLTKADLRLARNEIYARRGYIFKSADLQKYFASQAWYSSDESYSKELTDIEQHNVDLIQAME